MARQIHTRWKIKGTLTAETPIHVGGMGGDADTDLALAVNGCGNYYIPGTSLAGALRGWMGRSLTEQDVNKLWGFQEKENGYASFVVLEDAQVSLPSKTIIEIREGVGIDRHTGAAADKAKYNRAILPKGVTFPLNLTLDCQKDQAPDELWKLLLALENGDIRIGAAKTRGLGKVTLQAITLEKHDLNNAEGLFDSLLKQNLQQDWKQIKETVNCVNGKTPSRLNLNIAWKPKDPVMVKAEGDGIAVDILPLVSQVDAGVKFVIPGSSIKGVLRAHAERIVRTVLEIDITPSCEKFNEQIKLSKANKPIELIDVIFGSAEKNKDNQGKIGTLYIDDCYATIPMTSADWLSVENETTMTKPSSDNSNAYLKTKLAKALGVAEPYQVLQPAMHVAVDRWTGGAAKGMLYSVLEPLGVTWEAIGLQLDLDRLQKYHPTLVKPAIALLLLVLCDFANRKIPIGYGTNRGMGTVEVTEMRRVDCSPIEGLEGMENIQTIAPDLSNLGEELLNKLTQAWIDWIENSRKQDVV